MISGVSCKVTYSAMLKNVWLTSYSTVIHSCSRSYQRYELKDHLANSLDKVAHSTFQRTEWWVPYPHYTWRCPHSVGCLLSYPGSSSAPAPAPRYARSSSRTRLVRAGSNRLKAITAIWPSGSFFGWRWSRTAEAAPAIPVDKLTKFVKIVN